MIVVLGLGIVMLVCVVVLVALLLCNNSSGDEDDCRLACNTDSIFLCSILYSIFLCSFYSIDIILIQTEVRFVTAVTTGGSVKFLPAEQGGRTWQAFGGGKNGHETFRQAHIYNFRDKCVVFARNLKFSNLTL